MVTATTICMSVLQMSEELETAKRRAIDLGNDSYLMQCRLRELSEERKKLSQQIEQLSKVLLDEFGGPTGADGGAVGMAIRVLREQKAELEKLRVSKAKPRENTLYNNLHFRASSQPTRIGSMMEVNVAYTNYNGCEHFAGTLTVQAKDADALCAAIRDVPVAPWVKTEDSAHAEANADAKTTA